MAEEIDRLGVVRDHRWIRAGSQRKRLEAAGCGKILELEGKKVSATQADIVRMARPERLLVLAHAFLLADPKARARRGGVRKNFDDAMSEIHRRGGAILDLETGLTTEQDFHRRAIVALSHDHIGRSQKGLRSALNGRKSPGRPKSWTDADLEIVWREWHSVEHKTNADAAKAISEKIGRTLKPYSVWRIVRDMRRAKGLPDTGGVSGRPTGRPTFRNWSGHAQVVYFLGCNGHVKIGTSTDLKGRMASIQLTTPDRITLLGKIPGGNAAERELHKRFAKYRAHGEWFRLEGDLAEYVKSLPKPRRK